MNRQWIAFKLEWRRRNGWPNNCDECGIKVKVGTGERKFPNMRTIDHIIPKKVLYELELYELWFDFDNFTMMCAKCNEEKADIVPKEISPILQTKLHMALGRRKNELDRLKVLEV